MLYSPFFSFIHFVKMDLLTMCQTSRGTKVVQSQSLSNLYINIFQAVYDACHRSETDPLIYEDGGKDNYHDEKRQHGRRGISV